MELKYFRRDLPHFHPNGATFFVTYRLAGSLPRFVLDQIRVERMRLEQKLAPMTEEQRSNALRQFHRRAFAAQENALHKAAKNTDWLKQPDIAECVMHVFKEMDDKECEFDACCVMSNHVHAVLRPLGAATTAQSRFSEVMKLIKGRSANRCNRVLKRSGQFWERESYDHVVRSEEEWLRVVRYVLENPVKAHLVDDWKKWPWTYCRPGIVS